MESPILPAEKSFSEEERLAKGGEFYEVLNQLQPRGIGTFRLGSQRCGGVILASPQGDPYHSPTPCSAQSSGRCFVVGTETEVMQNQFSVNTETSRDRKGRGGAGVGYD